MEPDAQPDAASDRQSGPRINAKERAKERAKEPAEKVRKAYESLSVASLGLEMGISVFVGWGIGYWLDKHFGTEPYLMLVFLFCGIAAAFQALFRTASKAKAALKESNEGSQNTP